MNQNPSYNQRRESATGRFTHTPHHERPVGLPAVEEGAPGTMAFAVFETEGTIYKPLGDDKVIAAEVTKLMQIAMRQGKDPSEVGAWLRELQMAA